MPSTSAEYPARSQVILPVTFGMNKKALYMPTVIDNDRDYSYYYNYLSPNGSYAKYIIRFKNDFDYTLYQPLLFYFYVEKTFADSDPSDVSVFFKTEVSIVFLSDPPISTLLYLAEDTPHETLTKTAKGLLTGISPFTPYTGDNYLEQAYYEINIYLRCPDGPDPKYDSIFPLWGGFNYKAAN